MQKRAILLAFFFLISISAQSQTRFKSPDEFLPHHLGEQYTAHHQVVEYYKYVAEQKTEQCQLIQFGTTNEERPQLAMIISSKENMARLEEIRLNNLRRTGLESGAVDNTNPIAIVYMGYSVHGNEAAGTEASMKVLYELLNSSNANTQSWLKNTVVILDPSQNPDGNSRYTHWYRDVCNRLPDVDKSTNEHLEPWPSGRVNHYLFDLNRDWAWGTQVETQNRIRFYKQWMPHVHPDIHEQGSDAPYYFAPAAEPIHKFITPFQREFQTEIGKNHAKYFDENGWLYFTREVFDLFYPSYGDTYPTFNGAIGMTYEQGGIGAGRAVLTEIGDTLTLKDRILHHFTTSISTVEMASKNAARLVENFTQYFKETSKNPQGEYKTYIVKAENGAQKLKKLTALLDLHKIQYGSVAATQNYSGFDYSNGTEQPFSINSNDLIISAYQPISTFTQVLFDPASTLSDSLTYDITAWALPYAQGLKAYASKQKINVDKKFQIIENQIITQQNTYAYLAKWNSIYNARFLSHLLQAGVRVRFSSVPLRIDGNSFGYGTLIITRADNKRLGTNFDLVIKNIAKADDQALTGVSTGFVESGADFGSSKVHPFRTPRVLLLDGEGVANNAFGHLWYFFERDLDYPASIIPAERLRKTDLNKYDVLVITDGQYDFDDKTMEKIRTWVQAGGKLIAMEEALRTFEDQKGFALKKPDDSPSENRRLDSYVDMERKGLSDFVPGAIFNLKMDNTHPLAYGFGSNYYALKTNTLHYAQNKELKDVGYMDKNVEVIGFSGSHAKQLLRNSSQISTQNLGKGQVIYLSDNPVFRGFWDQGKLLLSNALFMVGN
jgi:Zinc carboxypeptidase